MLLLAGRARVVPNDCNRWDMGKRLIQNESNFSDKLHQRVITSVGHWGYSDIMFLCDKPKKALISLM